MYTLKYIWYIIYLYRLQQRIKGCIEMQFKSTAINVCSIWYCKYSTSCIVAILGTVKELNKNYSNQSRRLQIFRLKRRRVMWAWTMNNPKQITSCALQRPFTNFLMVSYSLEFVNRYLISKTLWTTRTCECDLHSQDFRTSWMECRFII